MSPHGCERQQRNRAEGWRFSYPIKDLKVKGAGQTLKRGTKISSIRLTDDEDEVDCRHDKIKGLVLRVEFLKKA